MRVRVPTVCFGFQSSVRLVLSAAFLCFVVLASAPAGADVRPPVGVGVAPGATMPGGALGDESDADLWRRARQGESFSLGGAVSGSPILIQSQGENWRAIRNGPLSTYGGWLLLVAVAAVAGFFLLRGRVRLEHRSGRLIHRFTGNERLAHWFVAGNFILLGLSGLILLFGKYVLSPVIGAKAFAVVASASLQGHNLFGPLFAFGVVWMFALYLKENLPRREDIIWALKGGMFFKAHVPSWKFNMGEKGWFWISSLTGFALAASGLLMEFPWIAESRQQLQLANLIHGASAVLVIGASLGHMYLGTIGVEGAFEGMVTGRVDEEWAKEHHSLWADEMLAKAEKAEKKEAAE